MAFFEENCDESKFAKLWKYYIRSDIGRDKILESFKFYNSFNEALACYDTDNLVHIGSGSYADVFRQNSHRRPTIFKIIRLLPEFLLDRPKPSSTGRATKYIDAYNEIQISLALSKLNTGKNGNHCQMFPIAHRGLLVTHGLELPKYLKLHSEENGVETVKGENPYFLNIPQESIILVMEDCGQPMRELIDSLHPFALLSIVKQVITGFAVAEAAFEFEHRDLHSGNILLQQCSDKFINYKLRYNTIRVPSWGYRVKMIDTTFSRIRNSNRNESKVYYTDLSHLFENFTENANDPKMQDRCYEDMSKLIHRKWQNFFPKTNLIWTKYVIHKLLRSKPIQSPTADLARVTGKVKAILYHCYGILDTFSNSSQCFNYIQHDHQIDEYVQIIFN